MPGDLEKGKYLPASLSGKKPREGWLGKVLLLEMVVAFECVSLLEFLCKSDNEYVGGPSSYLVCRLWGWDGV